jgi:hypothetical protein
MPGLPVRELVADVREWISLAIRVCLERGVHGREQAGPVKARVGELGGKPRDDRAQGRNVVQRPIDLLPDLGERRRPLPARRPRGERCRGGCRRRTG